jgi:Carboxypeptidase regulatory-like domain
LTRTITDRSAGRIADAKVIVTFAGTGLQREVRTSDAGSYYIPSLPIGACSLVVSRPGLQTVQVENVTLAVGGTRNIDVQMDVATVESQVNVKATTSALETNSAAVAGVIQFAQVQKIPLNGRNWATLMVLTPGAIDTGDGDQKSVRFVGRIGIARIP